MWGPVSKLVNTPFSQSDPPEINATFPPLSGRWNLSMEGEGHNGAKTSGNLPISLGISGSESLDIPTICKAYIQPQFQRISQFLPQKMRQIRWFLRWSGPIFCPPARSTTSLRDLKMVNACCWWLGYVEDARGENLRKKPLSWNLRSSFMRWDDKYWQVWLFGMGVWRKHNFNGIGRHCCKGI